MQTDNRLLDDLARVASGALGTLQGVGSEVTARLRDQFERVLANLDMVSREEFDAVKAMAAAARGENEALAARLDALEGKRAGKPPKRSAAKAKAKPAKAKAKPKPKPAKAKPAKAASAGAASAGAASAKPKPKPAKGKAKAAKSGAKGRRAKA